MRSSRRTQSRSLSTDDPEAPELLGCHPLGERIAVRIHGLIAARRKRVDEVDLPVADMSVSQNALHDALFR
jgi:hypothetical protein